MSSPSSPPRVSAGITVNVLELVEAFPNYKDPERVRNDVLRLSKQCKTLVPKRGSVAVESGRVELLTLHGTFPMMFRSVEYHTPVQVYVPENYPKSPPICYIVPTPGMSLRVGHHNVDQTGLVSTPYLREWSGAISSLVGLVESLSTVFGAEPPLFATPASTKPTKKKPPQLPPGKENGTVQVVCPSYGRTGTTSMQAALEILGFGPCYHMGNVFKLHTKDHPQLWLDGFQGRGLAVNKILAGYKSVCDWPAASFYKEILAANPDAKVVVTQRDADAWWKSIYVTIHRGSACWNGWGMLFLEVLFADLRLTHHMTLHIKTLSMGEEEAKADYARHNAEVLAHVNPDKLLQFSVKDGWEPLCDFLGVPVPDEPFPHADSTKDMIALFRSLHTHGWLMMTATIAVAGASIAAAAFYGGKRAGGALAATEAVVLASRFRKAVAMRRVWSGEKV